PFDFASLSLRANGGEAFFFAYDFIKATMLRANGGEAFFSAYDFAKAMTDRRGERGDKKAGAHE
ncbi:MAG: hypothetical protein Q8Q25_00025, partial [bacterium]|nr:hypothetical protein [bacterium]